MAEAGFEEKVIKELDSIKKQLTDIREHMVDIDCILTDKERKLVDKSYEHQKKKNWHPFQNSRNNWDSNMFEIFLDTPAKNFLETPCNLSSQILSAYKYYRISIDADFELQSKKQCAYNLST